MVTGCTQLEAASPTEASVDVNNVNGFDSVRFDWIDTTCDGPVDAEFHGVTDGYQLSVKQPTEPCPGGDPIAIVVDYRIPMPDALVRAGYLSPPPMLGCAEADQVRVVDKIGTVLSCTASSAGTMSEDDVLVDNPDGDANALRLSWRGSQCTYEIHVQQEGDQRGRDTYGVDIFVMDDDCGLGADVHAVTLQLSSPLPSYLVDSWSIGGPPRSPESPGPVTTPVQSPSSSAAQCERDDDTSNATLMDYAGIVNECSVTAVDDPGDPIVIEQVDADEVEVTYQIPCTWTGASIGVWPLNREFGARYFIFVERLDLVALPGEPAPGCRPALSGVRVHLTLAQPMDATELEVGLGSYPVTGFDWGTNDAGRFELTITTDKVEYQVGEEISPTASLWYGGSQTVAPFVDSGFGLVGPWFVEQLDGPLFIGNGASILMGECADELRSGEELRFAYDKPRMPVDGPPEGPVLKALYDDPLLRCR
jgi:hypothetical protein